MTVHEHSARVNRGFHRLGLFLAVLAFACGALLTLASFDGQGVPILHGLGISAIVGIIVGLLVYFLTRGLGWVIGGFAAS